MDTKENAIRVVINTLSDNFDSAQLRIIENALYVNFKDFDMTQRVVENTQLVADVSPDAKAFQMFFVSKKIEGLSKESLKYYATVLKMFFGVIQKPLATITTDDIRYYLASKKNVTLTTLNNERRVLSSFFGWLCNEEYIVKNPMVKIKNIKEAKVIKKPFSDTEIEEIRDACDNLRERALVEVLISTGMRCGELSNVKKTDVDFAKSEVLVTGKGNKQRICYLNASAKKRLIDYLASRKDNSDGLFVALHAGQVSGNPLTKSGIEIVVREIGKRAGVQNVHPHRFRRTSATMALQRGMPIEQVRVMLGHEKIETTTRYAITADETVKHSHSKYM